jgi:N-acetylmuramoyl-L-alanine amidase
VFAVRAPHLNDLRFYNEQGAMRKKTIIQCAVCTMMIWLYALAGFCTAYASGSVLIDPGHGGSDKGVELTKRDSEADFTLDVARKIKANLARKKAIKVILTRSDDRDLSIEERKKIVSGSGADLFVSLHINAGFGITSSGYEIYFRGFEQKGQITPDSDNVVDDMIQTRYLNDSIRFSNLVEKEMGKIFARQGRGLRGAPLAILDGLKMPAILIELGFATNHKNKEILLEKSVKDRIAGALSKSIEEYLESK